jgi:5'-deoxynucleotidase YfbR-like HD superfamily hydrolase
MAILSELEYRLQTVPRWGIVRTIQKQSVAEHSFFVAIAAVRIAKEYWGWGEDHDWYSLHREALLHDQIEAITGDVPAIAKHYVESDWVIGKDFEEHVEEIVGASFEIVNIVKAADLYEGCRFLATELSIGNKSVEMIYHKSIGALHRHMHSCNKPQHFKMLEEIKDACEAQINPMVAT